MGSRYYDRAGRPISIEHTVELLSDSEYVIVARDEEHGHIVSTIWLGLDFAIFDGMGPIIFETMIFGPDIEYCERFSNIDEARDGHAAALEYLRTRKAVTDP